jgi:hypothetical protein
LTFTAFRSFQWTRTALFSYLCFLAEYGIGITYDFSKLGLTGVRAFGAYAYGSMPAGRWEEEVNATVDYRIITGALKNCWLRLRYAHNVSNAPVPTQDFRVIFDYAIIF